jgi:hypothetical protein
MAEGDVEVEVTEEPAVEPKPGTEGAAPAQTDAVSADIADVQRKLDESEARRIAAEKRATDAEQRERQVTTGAIDDRKQMIQTALDTIDANIGTLKSQMRDALAAGDFDKHADLNVQLAEQMAAKPDLLRGKAALEQQAKQPQPRTIDQLSDAEKVELYVKNMTPLSAAWIRAHPQYVTDPKLNVKITARHWAALEAGHVADTDGYFRFVEAGLQLPAGNGHDTTPSPTGQGGPATQPDPTAAAAQVVKRRDDVQPSPAAPSRGGGGTRTIRLTPAQQEAARDSGMTYQEYAASLEREIRAGNIKRVH